MVKITKVKIKDGNQMVKLEAPYHPGLPKQARELGGDFNHEKKCWYFDYRDEERVRKLALEIYGTDGETSVELVTVRLDLDKFPDKQEMWMLGRQVAIRWSRDDRVRLGEGVVAIAGGFPNSGGSRNHPSLEAYEGTVLEIRDVPRTLAEKEAKGNPDTIEILEVANSSNV